MATTSKKGPQKVKPKPRLTATKKTSSKKPAQTVKSLQRDLAEALEQQTAMSEVLRVISSAPTDLQPAFQTILANITRLCQSNIAHVALYDGETITPVA